MTTPRASEKGVEPSADAQPERDPEVEIHVKPADRDAGRWRLTTHSV